MGQSFSLLKETVTKEKSARPYAPYYGHFFGGLAKTTIHFLINKTLDNTANFSWPIGDRINGVPLYIVVLLKLNYVL